MQKSTDISKTAAVEVRLDENKIIRKVTNDRFGLFTAKTLRDVIDPYVPYREGQLSGDGHATVELLPWRVWYRMPYAEYVYYSNDWEFSKNIHPSATDHWDEAAEQAGQFDKLYRTLNNALESGQY